MLLQVVYRVWAALHVRQMRDWLRCAGVLRWGQGSSAEGLAFDFGLRVDEAHATGEVLAGPDRIPVERPSGPASRPGSGARCWTRLLRRALCRLMVLPARWCSRSVAWPPAATRRPIGLRCSCTACRASLRDYVDDMVITAVGEGHCDAVQEAWRAAMAFSDGVGIVLHNRAALPPQRRLARCSRLHRDLRSSRRFATSGSTSRSCCAAAVTSGRSVRLVQN